MDVVDAIEKHFEIDNFSKIFFELKTRKEVEIEKYLFEISGCDDEVVIAKALRDRERNAHQPHHQGNVRVSEDGKRVSLLNHDDLMDRFDLLDSKTVYMEIHAREKKLDESFLRSTIKSSCGLDKEAIEEIKIDPRNLFAFVCFREASHARSLVDSLAGAWKTIDSDTHSLFCSPDSSTQTSTQVVVRAMLKTNWTSRMLEYHSRFTNHRPPQPTHPRAAKLEFQAGVVALFTGGHLHTHSKPLKRLIEMAAPVAFLDYRGRGCGYVRFKTWQHAVLAQTFFARTFVAQREAGDGCGGLDADRSRVHFAQFKRWADAAGEWAGGGDIDGGIGDGAFVLRVLEGREEEEYWQEIYAWQAFVKEKAAPIQDDGLVDMDVDMVVDVDLDVDLNVDRDIENVVMKEAKKRSKKRKPKAVHVIFPDDDSSEKQDAKEDVSVVETEAKRKPRHRSARKRGQDGEVSENRKKTRIDN